jgi:Flp pilus assembly pilin Flp
MERIRGMLAGWRAWWRTASDQCGQTLAEYSLIVTIIAVGTAVLALIVFRTSLTGAFNSVLSCLDGSC